MKIIGHRGAAGLALENTIESIQKALDLGVHAIEFDVRLTADRRLVLCHDADLARVSGDQDPRKISELTSQELKSIKLLNSEHPPLLRDVLKIVGDTPVIIETKVDDCAYELLALLDEFPSVNAIIASFDHNEIILIKSLRPDLPVFLAERTKPVEIIQLARAIKAEGVDLNLWVLNPLTYFLARRANLTIMAFTANSRFLVWFIRLFYPKVWLCTDYPNRYLPRKRRRRARKPA